MLTRISDGVKFILVKTFPDGDVLVKTSETDQKQHMIRKYELSNFKMN